MRQIAKACILAALLAAAPSQAQDARDKEIVVEAARTLDRSAVAARIRDGYPAKVLRAPIMRFHDPVCLQVNGLGPSGDGQVFAHMHAEIQSLGIRLAKSGCRANAVVVVSTEPRAQLERISARMPRLLPANVLEDKAGEFASGAHSVVWHNRTVRGANGEALPLSGGIAGWTGPPVVNGLVNNNGRASVYRAGYSLAAEIGVVAYDARKLVDVELHQLAHHAVMRLLAPGFAIDVEPGASDSVLSGIAFGAGPERLTQLDRAILSALYDMAPNDYGTVLVRAAGKAYVAED